MNVKKLGATVIGIAALALLTRIHSQTSPEQLQISAAKIDFGEVAVGSTGPHHNVTLTNATRSNITIEQIITSGIDFSQKNDCGQTWWRAPNAQFKFFSSRRFAAHAWEISL